MSLYADYITELGKDNIVESPSGFATYRYLNGGKSAYIIDIYVVPDERRKGAASALADLVVAEALKHGCTELLGTVAPSALASTASLKLQLAYGMKLYQATNDAVILRKEIGP